jgi:alpha-L-fucosidase
VPRFSDELVIAYTRYIQSHGGGVTWDVPVHADGAIPEDFVRRLTAVGRAVSTA